MEMDKVMTVMWILSASTTWAQTPDGLTTEKPSCFQGWTGPNSGGSCSFTTDTFCDWKLVERDSLLWKLTDNKQAKLSPGWWTDRERGRMRSPPLCEASGRPACVEVKFRFSSGGGSRLYAEVCGQDPTCSRLFTNVYNDNTDWILETARFVTPGSFEIFIVGEKYKDTFGGESDILIDYIRYNSTSCGEEGARMISSSTMTSTWDGSSSEPTSTGSSTEESTGAADEASTGGVVVEPGDQPSEEDGHNDMSKQDKEENSPTVVIVTVCAAVLLLLVVSILVAIFLVRRRRRAAPPKTSDTQPSSARNGRNASVTFTNELYTTVGQAQIKRSEDDAATEDRAQQSNPRPMTVTDISHSTDPYYSSVQRPVSSPAKVITNVNSQQHLDPAVNSSKQNATSDGTDDNVYDNADTNEADDKAVYENTTDKSGAEEEIYENTASRDSEPAATTDGADDTYEKMQMASAESAEYSHLIGARNRPDRRRENYDHITEEQ